MLRVCWSDLISELSVRKFLKQLGVTAQREIELGAREQLEAGKLRGEETLQARGQCVVSTSESFQIRGQHKASNVD